MSGYGSCSFSRCGGSDGHEQGKKMNNTEGRGRALLFGALGIILATTLTLVVLEMVARVLPVADATDTQPVNDTNPIVHFAPDRDITYSKGWNFAIVTRKHINNYGYTSDQDYSRERPGKLLTIIGDSYVEAMHVDNASAMQGILGKVVEGKGSVYGIGLSGAPLSQYLAFGRFARDEFRSDGYVFVIVGNDFDESLLGPASKPGMYYFKDDAAGRLDLVRKDYTGPSQFKRVIRLSALARYLYITSSINPGAFAAIFSGTKTGSMEFVGNTMATVDEGLLQKSYQVIDTFLKMVADLSAKKDVLFVLDGIRPQLYSKDALSSVGNSYYSKMREYFMTRARNTGYEVIDMQPVFERHYARHGRKFEFEYDAHWNALGHELAAREIAGSKVFQRLFGGGRAISVRSEVEVSN